MSKPPNSGSSPPCSNMSWGKEAEDLKQRGELLTSWRKLNSWKTSAGKQAKNKHTNRGSDKVLEKGRGRFPGSVQLKGSGWEGSGAFKSYLAGEKVRSEGEWQRCHERERGEGGGGGGGEREEEEKNVCVQGISLGLASTCSSRRACSFFVLLCR